MSHRRFLIVWLALLVILAALATWSTLSPAVASKNTASVSYAKSLSIADQAAAGKVPVHVGISIEKISDFSIKSVAWNANFYVWFRWTPPPDDPAFDPGSTFESLAGTIQSRQKVVDQYVGAERYELYRVSSSINYPFDVTRYPVDDHLLRLFILDPVHPDIYYIADKENSRVSPAIGIPGYRIARSALGAEIVPENSNLGNPARPKEPARLGFSILLLRQDFGFYLKLFQALFAAVGGFFAAVANSYITSTYLPDTGAMTLMDKVKWLGLAAIFLCMIQTVVSGRFARKGDESFFAAL